VTEQPLPAEVKQFIYTYINSVEQLEVLLLLHTNHTTDWSAHRVSEALRTNELSAASRLADLAARGILVATGESPILYRYAPTPDSLNDTISTLASLYVHFRFRIIEAIFAKPNDYVRVYADAFRIRKGDGNG
jgi:hypothetical protein